MKSIFLYCNFKKYLQSSAVESEDMKKKLAVSEARVARLKDLLEDQDAELLVVGQ